MAYLLVLKRGYRVVRDGMRTYILARSVTFYEQSLVDALRNDIGKELSETSFLDLGMVPSIRQQEISEVQQSQFSPQEFSTEAQCNNNSLSDMTAQTTN